MGEIDGSTFVIHRTIIWEAVQANDDIVARLRFHNFW
jgi:hypothetical protein